MFRFQNLLSRGISNGNNQKQWSYMLMKNNFSSYETILSEVKGSYAVITLNRPKQLNALCNQLCNELTDECQRLEKDDNVKCIVLTGSGNKAFAAGADIKEMCDKNFSDVYKSDLFSRWAEFAAIRKPIIAAVNGYALGGGCEVAMMCDIIVASKKAVFGQPEILLGVIPGMGGTQRLPKILGKSLCMELLLTGRNMDAKEAFDRGLVSKLIENEDQLLPEAEKMAKSIGDKSLLSVIATKECVLQSYNSTLTDGVLYERRLFHGLFSTKDKREGMTAFVEKRKPTWTQE